MTKYYNKLVRDNIPEIIEKQGKKANYRVITDEEEFKVVLAAKLIEEANELAEAIRNNDKKAMEEEVGDLLFAIITLEEFVNIDRYDVGLKAIKKNHEKGEFKNRIFLESVEE